MNMPLREDEYRRWVIEQATASFGVAGCDNDSAFADRVQMIANLGVFGTTSPQPLKEAA